MSIKKEHQIDAEIGNTPLQRFKKSMIIDYEKWHDGVGYDIEALHEASSSERDAIENLLIHRSPLDWRDIEALSELRSDNSRMALILAFRDGSVEERIEIMRYTPELVSEEDRIKTLVEALRNSNFYGGLSQALDIVEDYHPQEIVEELFRGALKREGVVAVHFAAMLFYLHGKANSPFDMKYRQFFLRFNTNNDDERMAAYLKMRQMIGVE